LSKNLTIPGKEFNFIVVLCFGLQRLEYHILTPFFLPYFCFEIIGEKPGIHGSISTLHSFLKNHKITLKKTFRSEKVKSEVVQEQRLEYWREIGSVSAEDIVLKNFIRQFHDSPVKNIQSMHPSIFIIN